MYSYGKLFKYGLYAHKWNGRRSLLAMNDILSNILCRIVVLVNMSRMRRHKLDPL